MKFLTVYLDFDDGESRRLFDRLPERLAGVSYAVRYRPLAAAGESVALRAYADGPNRLACEQLFACGAQAPLVPFAEPAAAADALAAAAAQAAADGVQALPAVVVDGRVYAGAAALDALAVDLGAAV